MPSLALNIDVVNKRLVRDFTININQDLPPVTQANTYDVSARFMNPTNLSGVPFTDADYSGYSVKIGAGVLNAPPSGGTFKLADGSAPTVFSATIAYNATAATVATALNAVAAITAAGGVTVTSPANAGAGGPWQVTWNNTGAQDLLVANTEGLAPISGANIDEITVGDGTHNEVQLIGLLQEPAAFQDTFTNFPAAAGVQSDLQVGSGAANAVQRLSLNPLPYGGTFAITCLGNTTVQLPFNADAPTMQAALVALASVGAGNVAVTVSGTSQWDIAFQGTLGLQAIAAMTVNPAGLQAPLGKNGQLDFAVSGIDELVESGVTGLTLQVDVTPPGGKPFTVVATDITLEPSLFAGSSSVPTPAASYSTTSAMNAAIAAAVATLSALCVKIANNGSDFNNLFTTLQNLWAAATTTAGSFLYMGAASALSTLAPNTTGTLKVLTMTSSVPSWQPPSGGGGGSSPWKVQSGGTYTLVPGDNIIDASGGVGFTLPASTGSGAEFNIIDGTGSWAGNPSTITAAGGLESFNGVVGPVNLAVNYASIRLVDLATGFWYVSQ